jgi:hypothetical protein
MTTFSAYDITADGANFLPKVVADTSFKTNKYLYGHNGDIYWAVVDPIAHPLYVWKKKGYYDYSDTAKALGAAVFSDGALMTTSLSPDPYGPVHSDKYGIDHAGADKVDQYLYLLGRKKPGAGGIKFSDYVIAKGLGANGKPVPATGYAEITNGLYPVILNKNQPSKVTTDPTYNKAFVDFMATKTIVAWALCPLTREGVITVAGSNVNGNNQKVVDSLQAIGAIDAVAVDGSNSVLLGEHAEAWFTPATYKEAWLKYGFSAGSA